MKQLHSVAILLAALIPATASGVSISDVLQQIAANNPTLKSLVSANAAEISDMRADNTLPATSIEYSPFFRSGESGVASSELVVSQEFDFPTLYAARSRQAAMQENLLDKNATLQQLQLLSEARASLLDLILLEKEREILGRRLDDTATLLASYERSLQLGSATLLEVNKVKLECQDLQRDILQNDAARMKIADALAGLNGNLPIDLTGIDYDIPTDELPELSDIAVLMEKDATIAAADAETEAARHGTSLAKSGWLPSLTLGYRRNTEGKEAANGFIIGAALPIFSNSGKVKAAKARLNAAQMQAATTRAEAETRLRSDMQQMAFDKAALATYDLTLMEETLRLYRKSPDAGQITLTDYYTETSGLYDRILTSVRLENNLQQSYARIISLIN